MKIPKTIYTLKSNTMFVVGLALFVMLFAVVYTPTYSLSSGEHRAVRLWYEHQNLCLPICCAIVLVATALSRTILVVSTQTGRLKEYEYLLWQVCEVAVVGLFCTLFLSLYLHEGFFTLMPRVLLAYISVALFPYTFYWLLMERIDRDRRILGAQRTIVSLRQKEVRGEVGTVRFTDEKGNVKLAVATNHVIAIESAGNYVNILYETGGRTTRYSLRNTLKGIEGLCDSHSLVRCHRSYYINLGRVKLLRKEADGVYAEIDMEGVDDIPVSKSYAAEVMQKFSER